MTIIEKSIYKPFGINRLGLGLEIQINLIRIIFIPMRKLPCEEVIIILFNASYCMRITDTNRFLFCISWIVRYVIKVWFTQVINYINFTFFVIMIITDTLTIFDPPHIEQVLFLAFRLRDRHIRFCQLFNRGQRRA